MERPNLSKLLGSTSVDTFFSEVVDKRVLHSRACIAQPEVESLLPLSAINGLFSRFPLHPSRYQIIKDGTVDREPPHHTAGGMDPAQMLRAYRAGQTIRLNSVHESVASVRKLTKALARECACAIFANIYMTPAGNPGFNPHYDDHDVIVLQCHGSKEWRIHDDYAHQTELPLSGFEFDPQKYLPGPASRSMLLEVGDTLYIPRGRMHSALTQARDSVHITFSLNWPTWNELLVDLIARAAIGDVELRRSIISETWGVRRETGEEITRRIGNLLRKAVNPQSVDESMSDVMTAYDGMYFDDSDHGLVDEGFFGSWSEEERAA